ncbi:ABC transporter permease [Candidatus Woesearchaeota archaeon]|nr:ABC transporter permease [Candidatus Woesearchaeota archaeon]
MIGFYASLAVTTFKKRRLRSWLTMLGIFIGIAAIVSLISLGQGLKNAVGAQFAALGTDRIIIQAKSLTIGPPGQGSVATLTLDDFDRVERVSGVDVAAQRLLKSAKVEFNDIIDFTFIASMPSDGESRRLIEEIFRLRTATGRLIQQNDRAKVVLGSNYAEGAVFGRALRAGDRLRINDEPFEIVGVLAKSGQPQVDNTILAPEDAMRGLYGLPDEVNAIVVQSLPGQDPEVVGDRIMRELRRFRDVEENREDFTVQTSGQLLETLGTVLDIVTAVLAGIAAISLLVGGIGITNTMYTSVLERTNEIGIMKSIGAKNRDIFFIFLIESGILGVAGGLIGIVLGMGLSKTVEVIAGQTLGTGLVQASFPWYLLLGALAFSFIVGSVAGTFPAMQASRLNPVDALRYR